MKKFIAMILIAVSTIVSANPFPNLPAVTINECKIDIYFGNGVWNSPEGAEDGRKKLDKKIKKFIIKDNSKHQVKYGEINLQYNWGRGGVNDLLETYYQLKEAGQLGNIGYYEAIASLTITYINPLLGITASIALHQKMNAIAETEQANVNQMATDYYLESLYWSHRVLLVSHSQGNLFANRVYDAIDPSKYKEYFANVQVGSPASSVHASMGDYVTNKGDIVINPIPGSMSGNANPDAQNIVLPECLQAIKDHDINKSIEICKGTPSNHEFVEHYLGQSDPLFSRYHGVRGNAYITLNDK